MERPKVKLPLDHDSLIIILTPVVEELNKIDRRESAIELINRVAKAYTYERVIEIVKEYVDIIYEGENEWARMTT